MENQQLTNVAWLAALFTGEGYVGLEKIYARTHRGKKRYYSPRIAITNTDPAVIVKCRDILRENSISYYISEYQRKNPEHKKLFTVRIDKLSEIKKFFDITTPFIVGEKLAKSKLVMEYVESRLERGAKLGINNLPYSEREDVLATIIDEWKPNDHTLPADILRRYDLNSDRKTESTAEMTVPTA